MSASTILVTGSHGQLGSELKDLAAFYPQYTFFFYDMDTWPIDDEGITKAVFEKHQPAYLINCAAYTAVDKAETEKELALSANATAVGYLAKACTQYGTRMVHISTDYVFNGTSKEALKEEAPVDPVNYYGESKLKGEEAAVQYGSGPVIIRTAWVYSAYGKNFVKTMMKLMAERESLSVIADQHGSPTYAADLAAAIMHIIASGKWEAGIYHFTNEANITWADFAAQIRDNIGSTCKIVPITTDQYPTPAKRPQYSVMDKTKIQQVYGIKLKDWKESLSTCISKIIAAS